MTRPIISVEGLGKEYVIGARAHAGESFREVLWRGVTSPLRRLRQLRGNVSEEQRFWALKDVSFEVRPGEVVGIIGRNGAGKSTLLKILSRITEPTEGRVELQGRTASLLEVGTGFHPELTGRENIYLNGAVLGMRRREIASRFDEIVAFAEIDKFLDTPVKRYSSGMYMRLAFAVAAHLDPDILFVDEVLAVGDIAFQRKCLGAMESLASSGRTVIFVSHNMSVVQRLCSRAMVIDAGRLKFSGNTAEAISVFLSSLSSISEAVPMKGPLCEVVAIQSLKINGHGPGDTNRIRPKSEIVIDLELKTTVEIPKAKVILTILKFGQKIIDLHDVEEPDDLPCGRSSFRVSLPTFFLSPGEYEVTLLCYSEETLSWTLAAGLSSFVIVPESQGSYDLGNIGLVHLLRRGDRFVCSDVVESDISEL